MRNYVLVCFCLAPLILFSQTFTGGVCAGFTTSQINNDDVGGFYKFGPTGGMYIQKQLSELYIFQFEMRYSGKGSGDGTGGLRIHLGYIETPLILHYNKFAPFSLYGGLSPAYKLFETTSHSSVPNKTDDFARFEIPFAIGAQYQLFSKIYADVRYTQSTLSAGARHWFLNQCLYFTLYKKLGE